MVGRWLGAVRSEQYAVEMVCEMRGDYLPMQEYHSAEQQHCSKADAS